MTRESAAARWRKVPAWGRHVALCQLEFAIEDMEDDLKDRDPIALRACKAALAVLEDAIRAPKRAKPKRGRG